jgi:thiol-disulfide isomerase/thioredoxin
MTFSEVRKFAAVLAAAVLVIAGAGRVWAAEPAAASPSVGAPAPSKGAAAPDMAVLQAAMTDIQAGTKELGPILGEEGVYTDAAKRAAALKKASPILDKMAAAAEKFNVGPQYKVMYTQITLYVESTRVALGDEAFIAKLKEPSAGKDAAACHARAVLARGAFIAAGKDPAAQDKALALFAALIKDFPADDEAAFVTAKSHFDPAATEASKSQIETLLKTSTSKEAKQPLAMWEGDRTLAAIVSKPLVIKAVKLGGGEFSSEEYKGKVILVDFWATWCGPCIGELPRVTKIYQQYHEKGLEMIGVSCDKAEKPLQDWLAAHKEMTWVQLFDPKTPGWHPLAKEYGINGIPTMFLIDKKGVVRTVKARNEMEELIPKLLAE